MSTDKLKYDSTGAGEFVRGGVGVDFASPGGNSKDPAGATATVSADGDAADAKPVAAWGGVSSAKPTGGFARPGGDQGI